MRKRIEKIAAGLLVGLMFSYVAAAEQQKQRHFIFIGEPNAAAWKYMMNNPEDRKAAVVGAFKALGGEVIGYYFGLGDGKNYILVTIPDNNELIQAIYLMRLPAGLLNSYQVIELMPSDQMTNVLKKARELIERDSTVKK